MIHPTIDFDNVKELIGLNDEYGEYAIHDYDLPKEVGEYTPIEELGVTLILDEINEILGMWFSDIEELVENIDDDGVICYSNCDDM